MTAELFNYIDNMLDNATKRLAAVQTIEENVAVELQLWDEADQYDWECEIDEMLNEFNEVK